MIYFAQVNRYNCKGRLSIVTSNKILKAQTNLVKRIQNKPKICPSTQLFKESNVFSVKNPMFNTKSKLKYS